MTSFRWTSNLLNTHSVPYTTFPSRPLHGRTEASRERDQGTDSLIDEFSSAVKELVNAGEDTVVHLAVGGGRAISAIVDATGEVTKVTVETAGNVVGTISESAVRIAKGKAGKGEAEEKENE